MNTNGNPLRKRWTVKNPISPEVKQELSEYSELLQQLLFNRGVVTKKDTEVYLNRLGSLYNPLQLKGMNTAITRIQQAIEQKETIAVYGDYDVDGVTATVLLVQALQATGAQAIGFIPNRFEEGYGLSKEPLQKLYDQGVGLVITVDCGIRSWPEVDFCNGLGMDIIITDHHEPRDTLPNALAVICPKQEGDLYPEKNLAGVGVAFKLAEALFGEQPSPTTQVNDFLDLVAVGTVADIVPLTGENRALVKAGLKRLRLGQRLGFRSLAGVASLRLENVNTRDIGFGLGPRLNAAGRMDTAQMAYNLLISNDPIEASNFAQQLDDRNRERQEITRQHFEIAEQLLSGQPETDIIIAIHPDFNMGVVGLVASRLVETHYRPAIVGCELGDSVRASCRSIPEFHITHALDECADLFDHHGGHAMAAGFTLLPGQKEALGKRMGDIASRELAGLDLFPELDIDLDLDLEVYSPKEIFTALEQLEPTGQGNPEVIFCSHSVEVMRYSTVGKEARHLRLVLKVGKVVYNAIAFRQGHWAEDMPQWIDIAYTMEKNTFRNVEETQLRVRDIQPSQF